MTNWNHPNWLYMDRTAFSAPQPPHFSFLNLQFGRWHICLISCDLFLFFFPQYPQVCFRNHFLFSVLTIIIKSITGIPFYNSNRKKNATMEKALLSHCYSFSLIDYGSIVLLNLKNLLSSVVKINIFYLSFFFFFNQRHNMLVTKKIKIFVFIKDLEVSNQTSNKEAQNENAQWSKWSVLTTFPSWPKMTNHYD